LGGEPFSCRLGLSSVGIRITILVCVCALAAFAKQPITVEKLLEFVNSSITTQMRDKDVAAYLATVKLSEKLDPRTVEELRSQGAGPKTIAALNHLVLLSARLQTPDFEAEAPKWKERGAPSNEEQEKIIEQVRDYALKYSKRLPDFICLQVTRRYIDGHYKPGTDGSWSPTDSLVEKLTYFDQKEKYQAISHNDASLYGKQTDQSGGVLSRGDFGTLLRVIFDPSAHTEFHWDRWGNLDNKHRFHVYTYAIDKAHSHHTISYNAESVTPAVHGEIFVQEGENIIWRVSAEPETPAKFPLQGIQQVLDYRYVYLSGQSFLLPVSEWIILHAYGVGKKNEIDFRDYRKYSADTSIKFEGVDKDPDPPKQ
jgi:hypothetical protein